MSNSIAKALDLIAGRFSSFFSPKVAGATAHDSGEKVDAIFFFYGPDLSIQKLDAEMRSLGFTTRPTTTDSGLIANICISQDRATLEKYIAQAKRLASKHSVEFDGWEREVTPGTCGP